MLSRNKLFLAFALAASSLSLVHAESQEGSICTSKESCSDLNNSCQCYCSRICKKRDKNETDKPVYIKNDPAGHHCYCKEWDYKNFHKRGCDKKQ